MSGALSILGLNPYDAVLGESSWRGVKFTVTDVTNTPHRNIALHIFPQVQYPYAEDLGTAPEFVDVRGFLSSATWGSPAQVYGEQEKSFRETLNSLFGPGIFVHPSLGAATVVCINASMSYSKDRLGIINLSLRFVMVDPKLQVTNAPKPNTTFSLQSAVSSAISSVTTGFTTAATNFLNSGIGMAIGAALTVAAYVSTAVKIATDAGSVSGETKGLSFITDDSVDLGRYANGSLTQAPVALQAIDISQPMPVVIQNGTVALRSAQVVAAATVQQASAALLAAAQALTASTIAGLTSAAVTAVQALSGAQNDPADQLRLLCALAANSTARASVIPGAATVGNLLNWLACSQLAETISNYQPSSSTDATSVLETITPIFQSAIEDAADVPDINSYNALQLLFSACWSDLTTRGAQLPPLIQFTVPNYMPACTLAQMLYQTGDRTDDLIQRINPINPLFCPAQFTALSY